LGGVVQPILWTGWGRKSLLAGLDLIIPSTNWVRLGEVLFFWVGVHLPHSVNLMCDGSHCACSAGPVAVQPTKASASSLPSLNP
jgi:hypothetical protein